MANPDQMDLELTLEEQEEIEAAIAEADLGGGIPADEVLRELRVRTRREEHARRG